MATKETAKKTAEKTIKNEVKCNATKEITKVPPKATTKVPPKKETPKETINATKEVKEVKKTETTTRNESMKISKPQGKTFEKQPSAGKQIRDLFINNISKLTDKEIEILTSAEKTKEVLKIRYAFIKEVKNEKDERKINGHARYGKNTVKINDKDYYITNDIYQRNIETFKAWVETIK